MLLCSPHTHMQKNIAIINPEDFGFDLAVLARKMGYKVTGVMVEDPERYRVLKDIYCFDSDGNARAYDTLISAEHWEDAVWQLRKINPCAIISGSEIAVEYTDRIASLLGLPCNNPETIPLRRNKIEMKRAVKNAGLPYAPGDTFSDFSEAAAFVRSSCGYPVVVKPVCGAGSTNVSFCKNEEEFAEAFSHVQKTPDAYLRRSQDVLVEEYISGDEYVVNMIGTPDDVYVTDIWKYEKFGNDYSDCVYYNDIMQDLYNPKFNELKEYAKKVYRAVGINIGPAHAEIKLSKTGPVMIEIGSRLAGGEMPKYAAIATNCNSLEKTLTVFINGTVDMPEKIIINTYPASADISHEQFGRLIRFNGLKKVRSLKSYKAEILYAKQGEYLEPTRDVDHLAALFWFMSPDKTQVLNDLEKSHKYCSITVTNSRILVVGTTPDYIDILRKDFPCELLYITDENLRKNALEKHPLASEEILCNLHNFKSVLSELYRHIEIYKQYVTGITCYDCESLLLASFIASHLHLPFPSAVAIKNCRNKQRSVLAWTKAKLNCPATSEITSYEQALEFFERNKSPCVIKPASGSGSELTSLCRTKEELATAWDNIMISMSEKINDSMYLETCGGSKSVLIQEYAEGTEYSCDFILKNHSAVILRLCRKYPSQRFGVTETYELLPEEQWPASKADISRQLYHAAKALGNMKHSLIMVDFIKSSNDFKLLEMSPRAGGDCIPLLIKKATGISTIDLAVVVAKNEFINPQTLPVKKTFAAYRLFARNDGILISQNISLLGCRANVRQVLLYHHEGFYISCNSSDYNNSLLGCVIYESDNFPVPEQNRRLSLLFKPEIISFDEHIRELVSSCLKKKECLLSVWNTTGKKPLRIFDRQQLKLRAKSFSSSFENKLPDCGFYFAMKSNNYPEVSRTVISQEFGLDVSSGKELSLALSLGCEKIEFSGPGKTEEELDLAVKNNSKITILIDSFSELEKLKVITKKYNTTVHCGVRILPPDGWEKFGILLGDLKKFFKVTAGSNIILEGIQFHTSWNMNSTQQLKALSAVSQELKTWQTDELSKIKFIDIGGGYWPEEGEWLQSSDSLHSDFSKRIWNNSIPINQFASELSAEITKDIFPFVKCQIRFEPGRWIVNDCMHILVSVIDKKSESCVITDGATNCIGWDRFQSDYFPVINLSHPAETEKKCRIYGSLCDPHDIWGFSYYGSEIQIGDVLLIPNQGAYTYSLQQDFIKPLPDIAEIKR